jgi:ABC-type transport system substrate-binding protein
MLVECDPVLAGITMLGLNPNTKFKDERIRQAMMLSIDWDKHIQLLQQGEGAALPGFGWPFIFDKMPTDAEKGPWWRFNPTEGKQLLTAAGADNLEFELVSASGLVGAGNVDPIYAAFAGHFREIGVNMKVRTTDNAAFTSQYYARQWLSTNSDAIQGWSTTPPSANGYFYNNIHSASPTNYFGINDPELDTWADQQKNALDPATRRETQRKIWDKVLAKAYRIESYANFGFTLMQPWVRYWRFNGPYIGIHSFYDWGMGSHKAWHDK